MKVTSGLAALLGLSAVSAVTMKDSPVQTFFVPIPEYEVLNQAFVPTNKKSVSPVISIVSFAVSTNNTVIWYDHWEDGYDADVTDLGSISPTTVVWGDGNITNGCAPGTPCKSNSDDRLVSGQSIVIENEVHVDDDRTSMLSPPIAYDARDRVQASFYIAITRGGYPYKPGAYLAGAVEVVDTASWGTEFEAPVGTVMHTKSDKSRAEAYELTYMYVMAAEDDTKVTMPNGTKIDLDMGGSIGIKVDQGDVITSTKNIQADIISMDLKSTHEIRWYSLVATKFWSSKYMTPMGDTTTETKVVLYNPGSNTMTIKVTTPGGDNFVEVAGKASNMTAPIPTGYGAIVESISGDNFVAQSLTDTVGTGNNNDWGFPLVPYNLLTPQVLIGWGYGCKGLTCSGKNRQGKKGSRSVVYVSCTADCDIYVDIDNDGHHDLLFNNTKAISSTIITDESDHDMSGAIIWATLPNSGIKGDGVNIAAAWGQDPARSHGGDQEALDLGTVVLPFNTVKVTEFVKLVGDLDGNGVISAGDILEYTVRIQNNGQIDIVPNDIVVTGPIEALALTQRQYVPGTCRYNDLKGRVSVCPDNSLASAGLKNKYGLPKHGGTHDITFNATVNDISQIFRRELPNFGVLKKTGQSALPFSVDSLMVYDPQVTIVKTVHTGDVDCAIATRDLQPGDAKLVQDLTGTDVTYCYTVINSGKTYLDIGKVEDADLSFSTISGAKLAPGGKTILKTKSQIGAVDFSSTATVAANPIFAGGSPIPDLSDVIDDDTAGVEMLMYDADVKIVKTVHVGHWDTSDDGGKLVTGYNDDPVTYIYRVTNTGAVSLSDFVLTDPFTGYRRQFTNKVLLPGKSFLQRYKTKITKTHFGDAKVDAKVSYTDGTLIPGQDSVSDVDSAGVRMIAKQIYTCPSSGDISWVAGAPTPPTLQPTSAPTQVPTSAPSIAPVIVSYTVASQDFSTGTIKDSWSFQTNVFNNTDTQSTLSAGDYNATSKALNILLGQDCKNLVISCDEKVPRPISAGFAHKFSLMDAGKVTVTYAIRGWTDKENEKGEDGHGCASLDGKMMGGRTILVESADGSKKYEYYDWRTVTRSVSASAGAHELIIGGLFDGRTTRQEHIILEFKDVKIEFDP